MSNTNKKVIGKLKKLLGKNSNIREEYGSYMSHYHCWHQDQPPACGIPLEKHKQCCLCDTPVPSKQEEKCEDCKHGMCSFCNSCHNMDCELFQEPINQCYDTLLPSSEKKTVFCGKTHPIGKTCPSPQPQSWENQDILLAIKKWKEEKPFMDSMIRRTLGDLRYKDFIDSLYSLALQAQTEERERILEKIKNDDKLLNFGATLTNGVCEYNCCGRVLDIINLINK